MLPKYEVKPRSGVGAVALGMSRPDVRARMPGEPVTFRKGSGGPDVDAWHEAGFQVFYSDDDTVEYIELNRGAVDAWFEGTAVFDVDADQLVEALRSRSPIDEDDAELGYSYVFPLWDLSLWRRCVPESPTDEEGRYFDTIGIGVPGYYGAAS